MKINYYKTMHKLGKLLFDFPLHIGVWKLERHWLPRLITTLPISRKIKYVSMCTLKIKVWINEFLFCIFVDLTTSAVAKFVDQPTVVRYGIAGKVCNAGLTDNEARVMCREVGYRSGMLLHPVSLQYGELIMLVGLNCTGSEQRIQDCSYPSLSQREACTDARLARIMCFNSYSMYLFWRNIKCLCGKINV